MTLYNDLNLTQIANNLGQALTERCLMLVSAESCTGGWIGQTVTGIAGSSTWYERGFITYSNLSKQEMLGVSKQTLDRYGAVSEQIAKEMAAGAICRSHAQIGMSVTGIAGPDGATEAKPLGMVCFGWAVKDGLACSEVYYLKGDRESIRRQAVAIALQGAIDLLHDIPVAIV